MIKNKEVKNVYTGSFKGCPPPEKLGQLYIYTKIVSAKNAFTLAEVLITLGIIGIVAALTIPTLIQNHKKSVVVSKLKKISSTIGQSYNSATAELGYEPSNEGINLKAKDSDSALKVFNKIYTPYLNGAKVEKGQLGVYAYLNDGTAIYFIKTGSCGDDFACTYMIACISHNACKTIEENKDLTKVVNGKDRFLLYARGTAPTYTGTKLSRNETLQACKDNLGPEACTALIAMDGWIISDDYPIKL